MFPYLLRTDSGFIYTFSIVWLLGLVFGCWLVYRRSQRLDCWNALLVGGVTALLLGRLQFVWQNAEWFGENPAERWDVFSGGFGYAGVLAGGLFGLVIWSVFERNPIRPILIALIPLVPLLHFVGWLACWFDGCGYGATTFISWQAAPLPDNFGLIAVRYQTQLAGMLSAALLGLWLGYLHYFPSRGRNKSAIFWFVLAISAAFRTIIYLYQGDVVPSIGRFRADMVLALLISILSILVGIGEVIYNKTESKA